MLQLWFFANTILAQLYRRVGGFNLSLSMILLLLAGLVLVRRGSGFTLGSLRTVLILSAYFLFSGVLVLSGPCSDHSFKALATAPILLCLIVAALKIGYDAGVQDWLDLRKTVVWILVFAFASFALEAAIPSLYPLKQVFRSHWQLSGVWPEPSHVAISLFPCLAVLLVSEDRGIRRRGWFAAVALLLVCRPTTLVIMLAAWVLYRMVIHGQIRQAGALGLGFSVLVAAAAAVNYQKLVLPVVSRFEGVFSGAENLSVSVSSLVYVQGWQDAWFDLIHSHGLGVGINMMGCGSLPDVLARSLLTLLGHPSLNAEDGSFLFAKVVAEAGVVGVLFYIAVIWRWTHRERRTRQLPEGPEREAAGMQNAVVFAFIVGSFLRTSGYFDGLMLMGIVGLVTPMRHSGKQVGGYFSRSRTHSDASGLSGD